MEDSNPPLMATYKPLFDRHPEPLDAAAGRRAAREECELPLIDLAGLLAAGAAPAAGERCRRDIARAAAEWGFFQVTNHGVPDGLLRRLRDVQVDVFSQPFEKKANTRLLDFSPESYRWGTPTATCLEQLSWSEAYHIPMTPSGSVDETRLVIEAASEAMSELAHRLASILIRNLGGDDEAVHGFTARRCTRETCFLRLNRYPPCAAPSGAYGLCPHTDSDFLTVLCQDAVGGLQLKEGGRWLTVKPNPNALIVNIGDLFQAWSNNLYRSVEHRVMTNATQERYSVAFFLCPSYDTAIQSRAKDAIYRRFTFGEYRRQVREDVTLNGRKIGLSRFLLRTCSDSEIRA